MLKSIQFENIYNFIEPQTIHFDSKCSTYVILGNNATGKTNLLDIIDNVGHSLHRKPSFTNLRRCANKNSGSDIIKLSYVFTLLGTDFTFGFEIDTVKEEYVKQYLIETNTNKILFKYQNDEIISDILDDRHIKALYAFNIKRKGIMFYVTELEDDEVTRIFKGIRKCAKYQDYIQLQIGNPDVMQTTTERTTKMLNELGIDVRNITVKSNKDVHKAVIQNRIVDKRKKVFEKKDVVDVTLHYDNYSEKLKYESRGVIKLIDICAALYTPNSDDYFVPRLIDEMSTSLSSEAFFHILNEFIENTSRQLVFTTNNLLLLENKTLPKESIIFVEKTDNGSVITKLSDYKFVRNDKRHNWRKLYTTNQLSYDKLCCDIEK